MGMNSDPFNWIKEISRVVYSNESEGTVLPGSRTGLKGVPEEIAGGPVQLDSVDEVV